MTSTVYKPQPRLTFRTHSANSAPLMHQFVSGLKSKHEEVRYKAARDLYHYVSTPPRPSPLFLVPLGV
jgi:hypothetical protein